MKDPYDKYQQQLLEHLDPAMNLACWLLRNRIDAEDAVQTAYVKALQAFTTYRGGNIKAWFLKIVRNTCLTHLQTTARQRQNILNFQDLPGLSQDLLGHTQIAKSEANYDLSKAIMNLSSEHKEVIILREIEGFSYAQIAEITGIPKGTVMSRLARARAALQKDLTSALQERHK